MFKTNFSGHNKIWGALPPNVPYGYGPDHLTAEEVLDVEAQCHGVVM